MFIPQPENIAISLPDIERVVKDDLSHTAPASSVVESTDVSEVLIFESQPIPTPVYALATPRTSCEQDDLVSVSSSSQAESTGSSAGAQTNAETTRSSVISSDITPSSSPIAITLAGFQRRLSFLGSWPFARSPPRDFAPNPIMRPPPPPAPPVKPRPARVLPTLAVKLVDFGNAQPMSETYIGRIQTRQYRAPEVGYLFDLQGCMLTLY